MNPIGDDGDDLKIGRILSGVGRSPNLDRYLKDRSSCQSNKYAHFSYNMSDSQNFVQNNQLEAYVSDCVDEEYEESEEEPDEVKKPSQKRHERHESNLLTDS